MRDDSFRDFVLDQLRAGGLEDIVARRMFGSHGLYYGRLFFGIVSDERLYLKTDATTAPAYRERGMQPFRPNPKQTLKNYYEAPADVVEDAGELASWARAAIEVRQGYD